MEPDLTKPHHLEDCRLCIERRDFWEKRQDQFIAETRKLKTRLRMAEDKLSGAGIDLPVYPQ